MTRAACDSPLYSLPPELRHQILTLCPDPRTLRALALSCKAFYVVFNADPDRIATVVTSRWVHPSVQDMAATALAAFKLRDDDPAAFWRFKNDYMKPQETVPGSSPRIWSISNSLSFARLQDHVEYFANAIPRKLLNRTPFYPADASTSCTLNDSRPSTSELHRLQRALYVFQMFCYLLNWENRYKGTRDDEEFPDVWEVCYPMFAQYEIEQQSCLNEYFVVLVAQCFNEIVQHDVTWGSLGVEFIFTENSPLAQHVLSHGLETLHMLAEAKTYEDCRKILHKGDRREDKPLKARSHLAPRIINSITDSLFRQHEPELWVALAPGGITSVARDPFYQDPDSGPLRVWWVAHHRELTISVNGRHCYPCFRRWGYVFWDEARLEKLQVFEAGWDQDAKLAPHDGLWVWVLLNASKDKIEWSQRRRREIWERGGTGWWSPDDESRVVYQQPLAESEDHL